MPAGSTDDESTRSPTGRDVLRRSKLSEVNGAFALAWREPDGAFCLARDHIGERSLFYATAGDRLSSAPTSRPSWRADWFDPSSITPPSLDT